MHRLPKVCLLVAFPLVSSVSVSNIRNGPDQHIFHFRRIFLGCPGHIICKRGSLKQGRIGPCLLRLAKIEAHPAPS